MLLVAFENIGGGQAALVDIMLLRQQIAKFSR